MKLIETANFSCSLPPELGVLLAATLKMLDSRMQSIDYISLLMCVLNNHNRFSRIQRTILYHCHTSDVNNDGYSSFQCLVERISVPKSVISGHQQRCTQLVDSIVRTVHECLVKCGKDIRKPMRLGFTQCRHVTLEGWVRSVLHLACEELTDPSAIFDALLTWGDVQKRRIFVLDVSLQLMSALARDTTNASQNRKSEDVLLTLRSKIIRKCRPSIQAQELHFHPMFTSVALFADNLMHYSSGSRLWAQFSALADAALSHPKYEDGTRLYVKSQKLMFLQTEDLKQNLQHILHTGMRMRSDQKISFSVMREAVRCALDACARWVPKDLKLNELSMKARYKWWTFNDCRDMALSLYGSVSEANEKMKTIFLNNCIPPAMKGSVSSEEEFFFAKKVDSSVHKPSKVLQRKTSCWLQLPDTYIPDHMTDPHVYNMFPRIRLPAESTAQGIHSAIRQNSIDVFPQIYEMIKDCHLNQNTWYLNDKDTVIRLVRCLLHRLDFDGAIGVMRAAIRLLGYGHKMDRDIQKIFSEIHDPSGSICFKLASGIMDGEVHQTKTRHYAPKV